jgi:hypothetical protein
MTRFLGQRNGLSEGTLAKIVVAEFQVTGEREVLTKRVPTEAIVGKSRTKIRVASKRDTKSIKDFTFEPTGGGIKNRGGRNRGLFGNGESQGEANGG